MRDMFSRKFGKSSRDAKEAGKKRGKPEKRGASTDEPSVEGKKKPVPLFDLLEMRRREKQREREKAALAGMENPTSAEQSPHKRRLQEQVETPPFGDGSADKAAQMDFTGRKIRRSEEHGSDIIKAVGAAVEQTGNELVGPVENVFVNLYAGSGKQLLKKTLNLDEEAAFKELDPVFQGVIKKIQHITSKQVANITAYTEQVANNGNTPLQQLNIYQNAGLKLQAYLRCITQKPVSPNNVRAAYGNAINALSWAEVKKQGLHTAFNLKYTLSKELQLPPSEIGRPGALRDRFANKWSAIDWTSTTSSGEIVKYTSDQAEYLIEYLYCEVY